MTVAPRHLRSGGEVVKAFVVPAAADGDLEWAELRAFARERLAGFKVPTEWETMTDLPRNEAGKLLRRHLRERPTRRL